MTETGNFKRLKLISPEKAEQLCLPAEAPVFVSPVIAGEGICPECTKSYKPLVYQVGYVVKSHHLHQKNGGIYYYTKLNDLTLMGPRIGWVGFIQPGKQIVNDIVVDAGPLIQRSRIARINKLAAFCRSDNCSSQPLASGIAVPNDFNGGNPADKGVLASLLPFCSQAKHPHIKQEHVRYLFNISEDGLVSFSMP